MKKHLKVILFFVYVTFVCTTNASSQTSGYKIIDKIPLLGDGKWDFLTFDKSARRLYVSHQTVMQVVDIDYSQEGNPSIFCIFIK